MDTRYKRTDNYKLRRDNYYLTTIQEEIEGEARQT